MSRLGTEISRLRQEKGLTRKQLAKLAGVAESFILDVETGKRVVKDDVALRIIKILGHEADKYGLNNDDDNPAQEPVKSPATAAAAKAAPKPVQQIWSDALGSILKTVPVYDYSMDKVFETRQLPVVSNKVEGFAKEKVFYLKIDESDMAGFRIMRGDTALACMVQEYDRDGIFFVEYAGKKAVRQVKKLDGGKLLLVSNKGGIQTDTVNAKEIKFIARLIKIEIPL